MSDTAQKFATVAGQVGPLLDELKQDPAKAHATFFSLHELAEQLPDNSKSREVIEGEMRHLLSRDFPVTSEKINDTLTLMAEFGQKFADDQQLQANIDTQSARMLSMKLAAVNQELERKQPVVSQSSQAGPSTEPEGTTEPEPDPEPVEEITNQPPSKPEPEIDLPELPTDDSPSAPQPEAETTSMPQPDANAAEAAKLQDQIAEAVQRLQVALDQLPVSTRQAMVEFQPILQSGGTVKNFAASIEAEMNKEQPSNPAFKGLAGESKAIERKQRVKDELEKLVKLAEDLDNVPPEADQLQSLYDQVDDHHKQDKGVFGYFQGKYGGNARRFVVERTAQYAQYVSATEAHNRMMEDLHKLIDQCQKELKGNNQKPAAKSNNQATSNGRSFFQG